MEEKAEMEEESKMVGGDDDDDPDHIADVEASKLERPATIRARNAVGEAFEKWLEETIERCRSQNVARRRCEKVHRHVCMDKKVSPFEVSIACPKIPCVTRRSHCRFPLL